MEIHPQTSLTIFSMSSQRIYSPLEYDDSIRILELTAVPQDSIRFSGRLITTRLSEEPDYTALSYAWGEPCSEDPMLLLDGQPLQIRMSLWQALVELTAHETMIRLWIDQVCIDQNNKIEQGHQVQLMSDVYKCARLIVCWLGCHEKDSQLAFHLLGVLGQTSDQRAETRWQLYLKASEEDGSLNSLYDLISPHATPVQAAALLVQRPYFRRLWVVQEVALASVLEIRCGSSSLTGDEFFQGIRILSSVVYDPPKPWLSKPYRNAIKLGQLRAQVSQAQHYSYPHLVQMLSAWDCKENHDRLIALFGLAFRGERPWFTPSYSLSSPELYIRFAKEHIKFSGGLEILHFAGCGDGNAFNLFRTEDDVLVLRVHPPADDIPSWVPDWRVRSRPLTLSTKPENSSAVFSATQSIQQIDLRNHTLRVRARKVDKIKMCGLPYCEWVSRHLKLTDHQLFNIWFNIAKGVLKDAEMEMMFASTLVMDGKVEVTESQLGGVNSSDIPHLFRQWATKNISMYKEHAGGDWKDGVDESTLYGYTAEEICRERTFFHY